MTKLLEHALMAVRRTSAATQDRIASVMLDLADEDAPGSIEPEHLDAVLEGLEQLRRGEYASEAEVEAAFRSFGP